MEAVDHVKIIEDMSEGRCELTTLRIVFCVLGACKIALPLHSGCPEVLKSVLSTEALVKERIEVISTRMDGMAEDFRKATEFIFEKPITSKIQ